MYFPDVPMLFFSSSTSNNLPIILSDKVKKPTVFQLLQIQFIVVIPCGLYNKYEEYASKEKSEKLTKYIINYPSKRTLHGHVLSDQMLSQA